MNEYQIMHRTYWNDDPLEVVLGLPCTEISSGGDWPNYLVEDINNARIRLENHGFINTDRYLMIPEHIYELFTQLEIDDVSAQDFLETHGFIKKPCIIGGNENSISLMSYIISRPSFAGLQVAALAIKITDVSFSQSEVNGEGE